MNKALNLKWSDIKSKSFNLDEYLDTFIGEPDIQTIYNNYKPKARFLRKIKNLLLENYQNLKILAMGAKWCHDCAEQVPRVIKIVKTLESSEIVIKILYGIKVNVFRKEGEIIWDKRHSVVEAIDPKFDLIAIPTFYFFNSQDEYLGRIIEHPKKSLEIDIYNILKNKL